MCVRGVGLLEVLLSGMLAVRRGGVGDVAKFRGQVQALVRRCVGVGVDLCVCVCVCACMRVWGVCGVVGLVM